MATTTLPRRTPVRSDAVAAAAANLLRARQETAAAKAAEDAARTRLLDLLAGRTAFVCADGTTVSVVTKTRRTFDLTRWATLHPRSFRRFRSFVKDTEYQSIFVK